MLRTLIASMKSAMTLMAIRIIPLLLWSGVGIIVLSIALGHGREPTCHDRLPQPVRPIWVRGPVRDCWLDPETGRLNINQVQRPGEGRLDCVSLAPWRSPHGQSQATGLWSTWSRSGMSLTPNGLYLARLSLPDRRLLDQVPIRNLVAGPPCWFPDASSRVIFASLDGHLYVHSFEPVGSRPADDQPRAIDWPNWTESEAIPSVKDISWPTDPRLGGAILASLQSRDANGATPDNPLELWWLRLNESGTAVDQSERIGISNSAGQPIGDRLSRQCPQSLVETGHKPSSATAEEIPSLFESSDPEPGGDRFPVIGTIPTGSLVLAYLHQSRGSLRWQLRVVPVEFDSRTGNPIARMERARIVAEPCIPSAPVFSSDGEWLSFVQPGGQTGVQAQRIRIADYVKDHAVSSSVSS